MKTAAASETEFDAAQRSQLLGCVRASWGLSRIALAERLGVSAGAVLRWETGETDEWEHEPELRQMWRSGPERETVLKLGLWEAENFPVALAALKRKLKFSVRQLAEHLGCEGPTLNRYFIAARLPNQKLVRETARLCREHEISAADMELERSEKRRFDKRVDNGRPTHQIVFAADDANMRLWQILHRAAEDTGTRLKRMAADLGISEASFYHLSRPDGNVPMFATQQKIYSHLQRLYRQAGLEFPLVILPPAEKAVS